MSTRRGAMMMKMSKLAAGAMAMATVLALGNMPLAAAENLKNGDFSQGLTDWKCQAFDPRKNLQPSARNPGEVVSEIPGNNFVRLTLDPNEYLHLTQVVRLKKPLQKFTVSIRAKAGADYLTGNPVLILFFHAPGMNTRNPLHWQTFPLSAGGEWKTFTAEMQSLTKADSMEVYVKVIQGRGTVSVDDVVVRDAEDAAPSIYPAR